MHDHSAHAEELISVKSVSLDASTILELKNNIQFDELTIYSPPKASFISGGI